MTKGSGGQNRQAEEAEDMSTQDIFIEGQRAADLQAYFLRSHLPTKKR